MNTSMDLSKMNDGDRTKEEALREIGKGLELGQPPVENERTAWWIHQLISNQKTATHVDPDVLLNRDYSHPASTDDRQTNDRKRKGKEDQLQECEDTEEAEDEQTCIEKQEGNSSSNKKKAFREARNLSERERRGKITEMLQKIQELLPPTNRVSEASILDGAITYMKSLKVLLEMLAKMSPENAKAIEQFYSCKFV
ncbi:hypothetical protein AgCh_033771 [Apium graveolens]